MQVGPFRAGSGMGKISVLSTCKHVYVTSDMRAPHEQDPEPWLIGKWPTCLWRFGRWPGFPGTPRARLLVDVVSMAKD